MDLKLTLEQTMLKDSVDRLMQDAYGLHQRAAYAREPGAWSRKVWQRLAEMGLLALPFDEADGGMGATPVETMLVMQSLGRALALEPYWGSIVLCGALLRGGATSAQRERWLPGLMSGEQVHAFAHTEPHVHHALHLVATGAAPVAGGWVLDGRKCMVLHGDSAQWLHVSARVAGAAHEATGLALFVVGADAPGVRITGYATHDGRRAADVELAGVRVSGDQLLGEPGSGWDILEPSFDGANAALCAESLGVMESMLALTLDHVKTRSQFGTTLGSFQAVQHQAADMLMAVEQSRSMALLAALSCEAADVEHRRRAVSAAKAFIAAAARRVGQHAIQLHGGIGMTDEYKVGHDFKRATAMTLLLGDAAYHTARVARAGGFIEAAGSTTP